MNFLFVLFSIGYHGKVRSNNINDNYNNNNCCYGAFFSNSNTVTARLCAPTVFLQITFVKFVSNVFEPPQRFLFNFVYKNTVGGGPIIGIVGDSHYSFFYFAY